MPDLLIELFSEEIPAGMQKRASEDLQKLVTNGLVEAGLTYAGAMAFATPVCNFIERHPTMKMLALSFLLLIGMMLVAEGFNAHISKGYIYFAMGFSLMVELLNVRYRSIHGKAPSRPSVIP